MTLDEMLTEWKAEAYVHRKSVTQDALSLMAARNARLIEALMKCREQRKIYIMSLAVECDWTHDFETEVHQKRDAELLAILRGGG